MTSDEKALLKLRQAFFIYGDRTVLKILQELTLHRERTFSQLRDDLSINPASLTKKLNLLKKFEIVRAEKNRDNLRVFYSINHSQRQIKKLLDAIENLSQEL